MGRNTLLSFTALFFAFLFVSSGFLPIYLAQEAVGECLVESAGSLAVDDSPAILSTFQRCASNSVIRFQPTNYTVYTPLALTGLQNVTVLFYGNWLLPDDIAQVQSAINATKNPASTYATPWIYIQGTDVEIQGSNDTAFGRFYGFGEQWWQSGTRTLRPQLATFNVTNGLLRNLKVIKPVAWGWNLPGQNIRVENHFVDAAPNNTTREDTSSFPFNTDGFNISGKNITIDGYLGHNGDDCVSVVNGAQDVDARNGFCGFSSHGLSIGSLGKGGAESSVKNVLFKNWTMDGAVYGARFKSWTGGRGLAENVTWEDIKLVNVSIGIFITQNYYDQDKGPRPENTNASSTQIKDFTFKDFSGSLGLNWTDGTCISNPCWNFVTGLDEPKAIVLDLYAGTASNISLVGIDIHPFEKPSATANVLCDSAALESGGQDILGFSCVNGAFQPTEVRVRSRASRSGNPIALFGGPLVSLWLMLALLF